MFVLEACLGEAFCADSAPLCQEHAWACLGVPVLLMNLIPH